MGSTIRLRERGGRVLGVDAPADAHAERDEATAPPTSTSGISASGLPDQVDAEQHAPDGEQDHGLDERDAEVEEDPRRRELAQRQRRQRAAGGSIPF